MSDLATAARPYARAVFDLARTGGDFDRWSDALERLAELASMADAQAMFSLPGEDRERLAELVCEAARCDDEQVRNLVRLLAENRRLTLLPALRDVFSDLRRAHEQAVEVTLTTAVEVDDAQRQKLSGAVEHRLGLRADIRWEVDESLVAGARIRAGDQIIDLSAASQLDRLRHALTA